MTTINIEIEYVERIENENEQLKQRINKLVSENVKLQNNLFTDQLQTDELEYKLLQRQEEITELKTKLYDATVKEQRLLKILNETCD